MATRVGLKKYLLAHRA